MSGERQFSLQPLFHRSLVANIDQSRGIVTFEFANAPRDRPPTAFFMSLHKVRQGQRQIQKNRR